MRYGVANNYSVMATHDITVEATIDSAEVQNIY